MIEPGQTAYEARFAGTRAGDAGAWADLPREARKVWAEVEEACTARQVLPQRRTGLRFDLVHENFDLNAMAGLREDGSVAEVFISAHRKVGTPLMAAIRDAAVLTSLALQYGCPLDVIQGALTRDGEGRPASAIGAVVDETIERLEAAKAGD